MHIPVGKLGEQHRHMMTAAQRDYDQVSALLATLKPGSVLDIGCGVAGIDILFGNIGGLIDIHLMDGTKFRSEHESWVTRAPEPWADVHHAAELVRMNVPKNVLVFAHEATHKLDVKVDLLWSSQSWGWHYPVSVYLELAKRCLKAGGRIVMDIRRKTDGEDEMNLGGFRTVAIVWQTNKGQRLIFGRD